MAIDGTTQPAVHSLSVEVLEGGSSQPPAGWGACVRAAAGRAPRAYASESYPRYVSRAYVPGEKPS